MAHRLKIGDCFDILLPDGRHAYCQFIAVNERNGLLVRVFDKIDEEPESSADVLSELPEMFPPVFVGLKSSVREGCWRFIGRLPVEPFQFPTFRSTNGVAPGIYEDWKLWDGKEFKFIGKLPPELRSLEIDQVWSGSLLEKRIATGRNPFEGTQ